MGIPVFLDMAEDDQILPMTYPNESLASNCQYTFSSTNAIAATVGGGRSTTPPPALPPRHPHRRLAPQVPVQTLSSNLQQYQPFYLQLQQQQQIQHQQQYNSEPEVLHRQQQVQRHSLRAGQTNDRISSTNQAQSTTTNAAAGATIIEDAGPPPAASTRPSALFSYYAQQQQQRRLSQPSTLHTQQPQPLPQPRPQPHPQQQLQQQQPRLQQPRRPSLQEMMFANAMQLRASSRSVSPYTDASSTANPSETSSQNSDAGFDPETEADGEMNRKQPSSVDLDEQRRIEFERQMVLYERYQRRRQMQLAQERWQQHQQANAAAYRGGQGQ